MWYFLKVFLCIWFQKTHLLKAQSLALNEPTLCTSSQYIYKNTLTWCPNNAITAQWRIITFRMCRPPAINTLDWEYRSCPDSLDGAAITHRTPPSVPTLMCPRSGVDAALEFTAALRRQWMEVPLKAALCCSFDFCRRGQLRPCECHRRSTFKFRLIKWTVWLDSFV